MSFWKETLQTERERETGDREGETSVVLCVCVSVR